MESRRRRRRRSDDFVIGIIKDTDPVQLKMLYCTFIHRGLHDTYIHSWDDSCCLQSPIQFNLSLRQIIFNKLWIRILDDPPVAQRV